MHGYVYTYKCVKSDLMYQYVCTKHKLGIDTHMLFKIHTIQIYKLERILCI